LTTNCRPQYDIENIPYNVLFSFLGETKYHLLKDVLGLPAWSTVREWRRLHLEKTGITKAIFGGEIADVTNLYHIHEIPTFQPVVLAIDALSIGSYVQILESGKINGLLNHLEIENWRAQVMLRDPSLTEEFILSQRSNIIKSAFVIY
jgi:hypothetical protein